MATRRCFTCGVETPAVAARFCANCGARFPDAAAAQGDAVLFPPPVAYAVPFPATFATTTTVSPPPPAARTMTEAEVTKAALYPPMHPQTSHAPYQPMAPAHAPYAQPAMGGSFHNKSDFSQQQQQQQQGQPSLFGEPPSKAYDSNRGSWSSDEGQPKTGGFLKSRYADHPNCDVCRAGFDIGKRRHQCRRCGRYICGTCSPVRLLIPWGEQIEGAKGYDVSVPQRACLHCAPALRPMQDELAAMYARANAENEHETKSRLHMPYTDSLAKECQNAADIIGNFFRDDNAAASDRSIPVAFLEKAQGLAIMTIVKAGFMISGKIGTGLVVSRLPDGSWSAPSAIGTAGLSGGLQIGGEIVEVIIILGTRGAVEVFHKPQVNLGAGLDIAVGPYGRAASAAAALSADTLNANYSYSHSKGLYAGIALTGSVIAARTDLNRKFYGRDLEPKDLLDGSVAQPLAAKPLYDAIYNAMRGVHEHKAGLEERSVMMGSCRRCTCSKHVAHTHQLWNKKCKTCDHIH